MKTKTLILTHAFLLTLLGLLSSCEKYHFSNPMPVDATNIYEFPKSFRGSWVMQEDTLTIGRNYIRTVSWKTKKIFNGVLKNPKLHESLKTIRQDSLNRVVDTVTNYIIKGNRIYENKEELGIGWMYETKGDTLILKDRSTLEVGLGFNTFLRQVSPDIYLLNMSEENIWSQIEEKGRWWQIALLEKTANQEIFIRTIRDKSKLLKTEAYAELCKDSIVMKGTDYYFDCQYTKRDLLKLIEKGLFEGRKDTLDIRKKIR